MVDRTRVAIAGAGLAVILAFVVAAFALGRASADPVSEDASSGAPQVAGDGLPSGPGRLVDGVPVGFRRTEEGALAAAASWVPWFLSSPASERPDGLPAVLAADAEDPLPEDSVSQRLQFTPLGGRVESISDDEAVVRLWGPFVDGELGADLTAEFLSVPTTLTWDADDEDWRVAQIQDVGIVVEAPFSAEDLDGIQALRPTGAILGGSLIESVPGE